MFDKLEDILRRYEDITMELNNPEVISDQNRFRALMKEQKNLEALVECYREYKKCKQTIEESLLLLEEESDPEMKEMLKEELSDAKSMIPSYEEKLKILLLPKDPNDDKNVIVEIRAGVGGDEAALFAADMYRVYTRYAERQNWRVETMSVEDIGIGGIKTVSFMIKAPYYSSMDFRYILYLIPLEALMLGMYIEKSGNLFRRMVWIMTGIFAVTTTALYVMLSRA